MAGGQMLDLSPVAAPDVEQVIRMQRLKTGALIEWACEAGAILANASRAERMHLRNYGQCLGLAFQIADDLLDADGDESKVGKRLRKDAQAGKVSLTSLVGCQDARAEAHRLVGQARDHLRSFGSNAALLHEVAQFAVARDR